MEERKGLAESATSNCLNPRISENKERTKDGKRNNGRKKERRKEKGTKEGKRNEGRKKERRKEKGTKEGKRNDGRKKERRKEKGTKEGKRNDGRKKERRKEKGTTGGMKGGGERGLIHQHSCASVERRNEGESQPGLFVGLHVCMFQRGGGYNSNDEQQT
nr:cylicin-2-like [Physcomitrium patens]|eukprot:XP_024370382.1 cylicin-2-like [Physcomitrella patens]